MTNAVKLDRKLQPGEIVLLQMNENTVRQAVVHRDDDVLTSDQLKQHWPEVQKAMLKELLTWEKLKCFSRRPRQGSINIIDVRWVIKFKWETPTVDVTQIQGGSRKAEAQQIRTIRAFLTVRGFKDCQRSDVD